MELVFGQYGELVLSILGLFAAIATVIPAPSEQSSRLYKVFYTVLSWLACNFGKARNATVQKR